MTQGKSGYKKNMSVIG